MLRGGQVSAVLEYLPMMAIISIALIALAGAVVMLLAASVLSSQISSTEANYLLDESLRRQQDIDSPPEPFSSE